MKRTSVKVLISASIILAMIPFSFLNVKAENPVIYPTFTVSSSKVYWEEDPEDSRYMRGTIYLSIMSDYPAMGDDIDVKFGTDSSYFTGNTTFYDAWSPTGIRINSHTEYYDDSGVFDIRGYSINITFSGLTNGLIIFQYRYLKTTYQNHECDLSLHTIDYDADNISVTQQGLTPIELELANQNLQLLILNENLSDQAIEEKLDNIITILQVIASNGSMTQAEYSVCWATGSDSVTLAVSNRDYLLPGYIIRGMIGNGFETATGGIKCKYDGLVRFDSTWYIRTNTSINMTCSMAKNGTYITGSGVVNLVNQTEVIYNTYLIEVEAGDIITPRVTPATGNNNSVYHAGSGFTVEYITSDMFDLSEISDKMTMIITNQLNTKTSMETKLNTIIELLTDISANTEQSDEIDLNYQEITNIDNTVNQITNNYNDDIELEMENIPLTDLPDHTGTDLINATNLYNTIFGDLINIPDVKGIIALLILCIVILAILG